MAVIGKIRERGTLLGIIVGGALVLFVVGDFIGKSGKGNDRTVGVIAGKEVSMQEYSALVEQQTDLYRQNGTTVDNQLQEQVRNSVWNDLLRANTLMVQAENAGFGNSISREEYDDIRFGNNVLPDFKNNKNFKNPQTGEVDREQLRKYFKYVQENNFPLFEMQKRTFVPQRIYAKYNELVKKSCFVNSAQVKDDWAARNTKADFDFVAQRLDTEPDSLYPVSETELHRFYDVHKEDPKWKQRASRSFAYVRFAAVPTQEDIEATRSEMADLKTDLQEAHGFKADSALVMGYADTKNATPTPYKEGTADHLNDSLIISADTGAVVGPFRDGNTWKLVKVAELADVPEARVRHILFTTQGKSPEEEAEIKERADSVLAVVRKDRGKFEAMVAKFSDDPGSKSTGGVYEWFDRKRKVAEFTKASFDEKVGAITLIKSQFGYHIVEVLGQRTRKERRVLTIDRKIAPLEAMKAAWKTANEFSLKNPDTASFRKGAQEQGLAYTPVDELRADQRFVPGLQDPAEVIRWVDHAEKDAKSSEPLTSGDSYVVCSLTGIREEGVPQLEDVREAFTKEVRKEKKGDALAARMKDKTDLDALAKELGTNVQNSGNMAFSANTIPGGYSDVTAIGGIFALATDATSAPLKGDMGVYVAHMRTLTPAGDMPEGDTGARSLTDRVRSRAEGQAFNALKESAQVEDDRSKFY
jgi:peptidyl-prolyl cis-trans isomerase D